MNTDTWKGAPSFPGCTGQSQQPRLYIKWLITAVAQGLVRTEHVSRVTPTLSRGSGTLAPSKAGVTPCFAGNKPTQGQ